MNASVKKLLEANDYIVKATKIVPDECRVSFPDGKHVDYRVDEIKSGIHVRDDKGEAYWECPEYAIRLMVASDVVRRMKKIGMSSTIINYYDGTGATLNGFSEIFSSPKSEDGLNNEGFLNVLLTQAMEENFPDRYHAVAEDHGVWDGYRLLRGFF